MTICIINMLNQIHLSRQFLIKKIQHFLFDSHTSQAKINI